MRHFRAACLQVNASNDMAANIDVTVRMAKEACSAGADLVLMPENVAIMEWGREKILNNAWPQDSHPALLSFQNLACSTGLWVHCGSMVVLKDDGGVANRTFMVNPDGEIIASYDKIHMFDVDLGNGEIYRESATFQAGSQVVRVKIPWGVLGLAICYDLRFPCLFRKLAKGGADFLAVPSAFTRITGIAHWHVMLRARAIENGCYVFAPAQCGEHAGGRQTYGHSLIISPWGDILADAGEKPGWIIAEIDPTEVAQVRKKIPSLTAKSPL